MVKAVTAISSSSGLIIIIVFFINAIQYNTIQEFITRTYLEKKNYQSIQGA
jgi:hypothetical protein